MANNTYNSPFNARYASKEMQYIYSPDFKFKTWRKLWIALAESENELGLNVTKEQIEELKEEIRSEFHYVIEPELTYTSFAQAANDNSFNREQLQKAY